uniref:Phosphoenolpyruvate synthase n=1 Tax=candidate division WOR-3 bacterium TaxID=2052148 RepID=A0A7C4UAZ1_UNCW3
MIIYPEKIKEKDLSLIGKKAFNLYKLCNAGINVPEWFVIRSDFFEDFFKKYSDKIKEILSMKMDEKAKSERIKKLVKGYRDVIKKEISEVEEEIKKISPVAIRSSAVLEDAPSFSFAGQFSSFLNVKENYEEKIIDCFSSIFNPQNISYHNINKIDILRNRIGIIVQKMIDPDKSGIMFTAHPETGENIFVINSSFGLCEGIVSGRIPSDTFILSDKGEVISRDIVEKRNKVICSKKDGVILRKIPKRERNKPSLSDEELKKLCFLGKEIMSLFNYPQDIEFSIKGDEIFILQSRPITTIKDTFTWDNSNIIESFSGTTTPLTFSFANEVYSIIYKIVLKNLGVSDRTLRENEMFFSNMIGFLNNRVYYSLDSWYTALSLLPAYQVNKGFMEGMMGVKKSFDIKKKKKVSNIERLYETIRIGIKMFSSFVFHKRNMERFNKKYYEAIEYFNDSLSKNLTLKEYVEVYHKMKEKILYHWIPPINNDIFTMIFYGLFKKYLISLLPEYKGIHNEILKGIGDIESSVIGEKLIHIVECIRKEQELFKIVKSGNSSLFFEKLKEFEYINSLFMDFINKYGNRSCNELKLEVSNVKEEPKKLFNIIKNMIERDPINLPKKNQKRDGYKNVISKIYKKPFPFNLIHLIIFKFLLTKTEMFIRYRENQRLQRSNIFGAVRDLFLRIGEEFSKIGIIERRDDIFFLTHYEIFSYINGTSVTSNLKEIIRLRKKEYRRNKDRNLQERFTTFIPPYLYLVPFRKKEECNLIGLGCSPGKVKGKVQIVKDPYKDKIKGDIMVAAQTDPGWLPIFPLFKGIIIERGSMLSHSAIVARELGIPTIVGARGVIEQLKNGDTIEMDGGTGKITILRR